MQPQRYASRSTMDNNSKISKIEVNIDGQDTGQSKMANIGSKIMKNMSMEQGDIFKKQEKDFNIISFYPKQVKPNLRNFPRLTLEDKLL